MDKKNEDTQKILAGLLIGVMGAGALYYMYRENHQKTPLLKTIGKTVVEIGETLENYDLHSQMQNVEKKIPTGADLLNKLRELVSSGFSIWKHLKN